ncbi:MAG: type II toxin-antitoxin system VapB family antitoxin [Verrucomicrobiota bacterium]|nr:type II toxin-antitoxin system VapB family antitoxin [Verrucomicrobiota bacterium]
MGRAKAAGSREGAFLYSRSPRATRTTVPATPGTATVTRTTVAVTRTTVAAGRTTVAATRTTPTATRRKVMGRRGSMGRMPTTNYTMPSSSANCLLQTANLSALSIHHSPLSILHSLLTYPASCHTEYGMKMTMHIDEELLARVMNAYGYESKTEAVEMALRELDRRTSFRELGEKGLEMTPDELANSVYPDYDVLKSRGVAEPKKPYG